MTTANLSVGINTAPALASLSALRGELQKLASGDYTINATSLINKVQASLDAKPFNIRISGALAVGELKSEVGKALREVITQTRRPVSIDGVRLRNTVKLALESAFRASHYHIGSHNVSIDPELFTKGALGATGFSKFLSNMPLGINEIALAGQVQNAFRAGVASAPDQIAQQIRGALKGVELLVDANIGVNDAYLQRDLRRALASKGLLLPKVRLSADEEALRASVLAGIGTNHNIDINSASLTAQISAAVKAGFGVTQRPYTPQELDQFGKLHAEYQKLLTGTGNRPSPGSKRGKRYDEIMAQASAIKALAESETSRADIRIGINEAALVQQVQTALAREFVVGINSTDLTGKVQAAVTAGMRAGTVAGTLPVAAAGVGAASAVGGGDVAALRGAIDLLNNHLRDAADTTSVRKKGTKPAKTLVQQSEEEEEKPKVRYSRSRSAKTPSGEMLRRSENIDPVTGESDIQGLLMGPSRADLDKELSRLRKEADRALEQEEKIRQGVANRTIGIRRAARRKVQEAEQQAAQFGPDRSTFDASLAARRIQDENALKAEEAYQQKIGRQNLAMQVKLRKERLDAERRAAAFGPDRSIFDASLAAQRKEAESFERGMEKINQESSRRVMSSRVRSWKAMDRADILDSQFRNAGAKTDTARIESQLAKLHAAQDLMAQGSRGAQLALQKYGPLAISQVPQIDALTASLARLRAAEAALRGGRGVNIAGDLERNRAATVASTAAMTQYNNTLREGHSLGRGFAGSMGAMWLTWGSLVPLVAGAALGATLRSVFTTGKDLEYQLKFVAVLTDSATISITRFGDAVRGSMVVPTEAAQAMRGLAQNGLDAGQAFMALPAILRLATAGEMELMEAALGATGVMAAFNLQVVDLGRVGDVFAKAAAMSNTSVSSMVESMKQASSVGDAYHVTLEETAAALATLAKRNIIGTASGTAFRNMIVELAAPSRKARLGMEQIGLSVFDSSNKLKGFVPILEELRTKTALLDEKSKLIFLNDIFDERGAKAANALLSDFKLFSDTLKELKENSDGFTQSVVDALGDTTQGKVKRLMTEFQLSTTAAFNASSASVRGFVDELRIMVSSDEFKNAILGLTEAVIYFTKHVVDNIGAIVTLIGTFVGLKAAVVVFTLVRGAVLALTAATVTLTAAAMSFATFATGGLALVAALAVQFIFLRDTTTDTTKAIKSKADAMRLLREDIDTQMRNSGAQIAQLVEENRLMAEGATAAEAKAKAINSVARAKLLEERANTLTAIRQNSINLEKTFGHKLPMMRKMVEVSDPDKIPDEFKQRDALRAQLAEIDRSLESQPRMEADRVQLEMLKEVQKQISLAASLNRDLEVIKKASAAKGQKITLPAIDIPKGGVIGSAEELKQYTERVAAFKSALDKLRTGQYRTVERTGSRPERTELSITKGQNQRDMEDLRSQLQFEKQLDDLKFSSSKFSPYLAALSAEEREQRALHAVMQLQVRSLHDLIDLRTRLTLKDPSDALIPQVDDAIQEQIRAARNSALEAERSKILAGVRAKNLAEKTDDEFNSLLGRLRGQDEQQREDISLKNELKVTDPVKGAGQKALAAVMKRYKEEEVKLEQEIQRKTEAKVDLSENELAIQDELINGDKKRLAELRAQAAAQGAIAQQLAIDVETYSRSAEFGFRKFWTEYVSTATSSAELVESAMKNVSSSMEDSLQQFLLTGTFGWKQFGRTIINELTRVMANQATMKILGFASNFMFGGSSGYTFGGFGSSVSGISGYGGTDGSLLNFLSSVSTQNARGGIMSADGRVPLRQFAAGGIARGRMFAEYGEGSWAEAIVPLPDGRSIPVDVRGGEGGKLHQEFHVTVQVQGGQTNAETGNVVSKAVVDTMRGIARGEIREAQRQGGVLYKG